MRWNLFMKIMEKNHKIRIEFLLIVLFLILFFVPPQQIYSLSNVKTDETMNENNSNQNENVNTNTQEISSVPIYSLNRQLNFDIPSTAL